MKYIYLAGILLSSLCMMADCPKVFNSIDRQEIINSLGARKILYMSLEDGECQNVQAGYYDIRRGDDHYHLLLKFEEDVCICRSKGFYNIYNKRNGRFIFSVNV